LPLSHLLNREVDDTFEGFQEDRIDVGSSTLFARYAGEGPLSFCFMGTHEPPQPGIEWHPGW
jgi:hypothetical protein